MRKLPDEGQIITSSWCICAIKILPGRPIANALGYRRLFRFCLVKVIHRSQSRAIWKKKLRHARTKIRNSAFGWHWLSMKSTRGEANKMSVLFRQNWVITQFRSCWGIFKTIVVAFGTLRPRQNLIIKLTVWSLVFDWSRRTDGILAATWAFIFLCLKAVKKKKTRKKWHLKGDLVLMLLTKVTTTLTLKLFTT